MLKVPILRYMRPNRNANMYNKSIRTVCVISHNCDNVQVKRIYGPDYFETEIEFRYSI